MRWPASGTWLLVLATVATTGCNQNPYMSPQQMAAFQQQGVDPQNAQVYDLNRRATALDENNQDLHAQLAQSRQQVQVVREQVTLLQKQLGETANRLKDTQLAKEEVEKKYQALEASATRRGGAIITANTSNKTVLRAVEIPGLTVRQDGDLVRIELPTDQLFAPGTQQLVGSAFPILDQVASEIARNYPRQLIGIEGHTDGAPATGGATNHQLAAAQALAVFDQFTRRNRLPSSQFFVAAQGSNQPLTSNATQAGRMQNRRVELIVYPDTVDAR
ncbi:MAG: OmpA family protein [Pirellulaceae bacterium]|nr:OmpA family protein [Pirellulaceae bacterium]